MLLTNLYCAFFIFFSFLDFWMPFVAVVFIEYFVHCNSRYELGFSVQTNRYFATLHSPADSWKSRVWLMKFSLQDTTYLPIVALSVIWLNWLTFNCKLFAWSNLTFSIKTLYVAMYGIGDLYQKICFKFFVCRIKASNNLLLHHDYENS